MSLKSKKQAEKTTGRQVVDPAEAFSTTLPRSVKIRLHEASVASDVPISKIVLRGAIKELASMEERLKKEGA